MSIMAEERILQEPATSFTARCWESLERTLREARFREEKGEPRSIKSELLPLVSEAAKRPELRQLMPFTSLFCASAAPRCSRGLRLIVRRDQSGMGGSVSQMERGVPIRMATAFWVKKMRCRQQISLLQTCRQIAGLQFMGRPKNGMSREDNNRPELGQLFKYLNFTY